jgi:hypothetical protein
MDRPIYINGRWTIWIAPSAEIVGGHCYVLNGVNTTARVFRMKNSWGRGWGIDGRASISFADMERLILDNGEACMAVQV